ncbi:MAG TPA: Ig-like domain-containing protein, partial [Terracidiphilus sp.]
SKLKAGNYSIVATYSGDSNYSKTTDSISLAVGQAGTSISLVSSSPTSTVNQSVTFTATVGPANANPALSGTVTVIDTSNSNATLCQGPVDPTTQQYSCATQALTKGTHKIKVTYTNDQNYGSSDNSTNLLTQTVNAGTATMPSFSSSSNPSVVGNTVTFTATISVPSGPTSPSGSVSFTADGSSIAGCTSVALTLSSPGATTGTASCPTKTLTASTTPHTIVANYTGDNNFTFDGQNNSLSQTVSAAATTTTITAAPSTTTVNQPVTYTVTITAPSTTYPLAGLVKITDNGTVVCDGLTLAQQSGSLVGTNQQCVESNLTAGVHTITATYYNDTNNGTSNGSTTVPVQAASTTVVVVSSLNPSIVQNPKNVNDTVTFTATVGSTGTVSVPLSGTVSFTANGLTLLDCPAKQVNASGQATCTTTSLVAGADTILAVYSNDPNYTGSSGYLSGNGQIIPQMVQDFSLVVSSAPPVAVSQGSTTSNDLFTPQTISVVPLSTQGFATASGAPLSLSCSVTTEFSPASSPTRPLCTLASGSLAVNGTGAQAAVGLMVDATNASAGLFSVQVSGTDPTTGLVHSSAPFTVTVRAASTPLTFVSGSTTGNSGNLSFLLPGGVTLSNLACLSVSGPNLTGSVTPATLGISCSFNPASVTNTSTSIQAVSVTVTVNTGGSSGTSTAAIARHTNLWLAGLLGLPIFGLMGLVRGRKSPRSVFFRFMAIVVICAAGFQAIGCGGSFVTQPSNAGSGGKTPPGVYKVLVAGTGSDGQTYQAVLQLNVQL